MPPSDQGERSDETRWSAPDDSYFWPLLAAYRSPANQTIEQAEATSLRARGFSNEDVHQRMSVNRWMLSPKPQREIEMLLARIGERFPTASPITYLEFGTCYGTTFCAVMSYFEAAVGIGLEIDPHRFDVTRWMVEHVGVQMGFADRTTLLNTGILEAPLEKHSVDLVLMDTNHRYPDDYDFVLRLIDEEILRPGFLFLGDDPTQDGTDTSRRRFIEEHSDRFHVETRTDLNLWWFYERDMPEAATRKRY